MKYDREEAYLHEKLTGGLHPAGVDYGPPWLSTCPTRPRTAPALEAGNLPGRAAADCRRSAGRHGRVHEPARKPAPVLCAGGQHRVRHHV